ncbi:hypothetical protein AA23498_3093 [Acetobacter nitrogenifigens DSM 23921 = NBRC 105050]|nr:hypothetical protein AA23498_3093 [Acetobacter nitrogenifigens DSM 23921 = NBRC 105050]
MPLHSTDPDYLLRIIEDGWMPSDADRLRANVAKNYQFHADERRMETAEKWLSVYRALT